MVASKYFIFFCKMNLILTWSGNCVISIATANQAKTFPRTDTKFYVPLVPLSIKLLQQFKRTNLLRTHNWNKYQSKTTTQNAPNQ